MFLKILCSPRLTLTICSFVLCLVALLHIRYTSFDKYRRNTLLWRRRSTSLLLTWIPCSVLWWAMRELGIDKWAVRLVKVIYHGANSRTRVNLCFSERFAVTVCVYQGSVWSLLLCTIVMEAFSLVSVVLVALATSYMWMVLLSWKII